MRSAILFVTLWAVFATAGSGLCAEADVSRKNVSLEGLGLEALTNPACLICRP